MAKSAKMVAQKWATRTAGAVQNYKEGIQSVKTAPGEKAAQAVDRMIAALVAARDSGDLQAAMRAVSLSEWQQAALNKGAERLASGARQAEGKMEKFMNEFLPYADSVAQSLPERGDLEQNLGRMMENARRLSQFKKSR